MHSASFTQNMLILFISLQNHTGFHSQLWTNKKKTVQRAEITRKTLPEL